MKFSFLKKYLQPLFWILILLIIVYFVLKTLNGGVLFWDDGFFPFNPTVSFAQTISSWDNPFFPGGPYYGNFYYAPLIIFVWIFRSIGVGYSTSEAAYIIFNLFIGALGIYLLSEFITLNYVFKRVPSQQDFFFGSALASVYYIFNYEQMIYYGGEFYQGFIMVNLTPIFLYLVLRYLSSPVKFAIWNRYLGFLGLTSLAISGGIVGPDSVGPPAFWFAVILLVTIFMGRLLANNFKFAKNFIKKTLAVILVTVISMAWVLQDQYFGARAAFVYATHEMWLGKPLIISQQGYPSILQNFMALSSSGYYTQFFNFGGAGSNRIWFAPVQTVLSHFPLILFVFVPSILSFMYILFLFDKKLKRRNILAFLAITLLFYLLVTRTINIGFLATSNNLILAGMNFSLSPLYAIYPFILITAISMAISVNILMDYLRNIARRDNQFFFSKKIKSDWNLKTKRKKLKNTKTSSRKINFLLRNSKIARAHKIVRGRYKGRLIYYGTIFIITILIVMFIFPVANNPLENWQYQNDPPITGVFKIDSNFLNVGNFLSIYSPYNNVLELPISVSPFAYMKGNSSFMIASPPFSSFFYGESIVAALPPFNNAFTYPILKSIPNASIPDFSNFLKLLSIKYIILNTAQYPTWVSANRSEFAGGGPPWNFSSYFDFLNSSSGISFVRSFGPYYIYEVHNTLPMVYSSYVLPSADYGTITQYKIFDLYANGTLTAGSMSICNSTSLPMGYSTQFNQSPSIKLERESTTQYNVQVSSKSNFFLILNQNFSDEWIALVNGKVVPQHYLINGFANGWYMPPGNYSVTILFKPQQVQNLLNYISAISGILISLLLFLDFTGSFGELQRVLKNARGKRNNVNGNGNKELKQT